MSDANTEPETLDDAMENAISAFEGGEAPTEEQEKGGTEPPAEKEPGEEEAKEPEEGGEKEGEATKEDEAEQEAKTEEEKEEEPKNAREWLDRIKQAELKNLEEKQAIEKEREQIQTERQQFEQLNQAVQNMQSSIKEDPLGFIEKYSGLTFEDLARRKLRGGVASPEESTRTANQEVLQKLEEERKEREKLQSRLEQQEHDRIIREYRSGVGEALQDENRALLAKWPNAEQLVLQQAQRAAQAGTYLQPSEAADRVQQELVEQLKQLKGHKAVQEVLGVPQTSGTSPQKPQTQSQSQQQASPVGDNLTPAHSGKTKDVSEMTEDELLDYAVQFVEPNP